MPTPRKGESRSAFVKRCIKYLKKEGGSSHKTLDQRLGKCYGIWKNKKK